MDSLKQKTQMHKEAIKRSILNGHLSYAQMHELLTKEIDRELLKSAEEVDIAYIETCQRLLEKLGQERATEIGSHAEQNYRAIQSRLYRRIRPLHRGGMAKWVMGVCLILLFTGMNALKSNRRITIEYSPDAEQIILESAVTASDAISKADTDAEDFRELTTTNWDELVEFLGSEPVVPSFIPEGWVLLDYGCTVFEDYIIISAAYSNDQYEELLQYTWESGYGTETFRLSIEQDDVGEQHTLANGKKVYVSTNMGSTVAVLQNHASVQWVSGPISPDDILQMFESLEEDC